MKGPVISLLRLLYLGLAAWGTVHPLVWYAHHMRETGTGLRGLVDAWSANASMIGLRWDVTIAAVALVVWVLAEAGARRAWSGLWAIPATFAVGLSCGLPLYLFLRTRPVA